MLDPALVAELAHCLADHFGPDGEPNRLVYLLDHEYTERSLGWSRLKGPDAQRAALLAAAEPPGPRLLSARSGKQPDPEVLCGLAGIPLTRWEPKLPPAWPGTADTESHPRGVAASAGSVRSPARPAPARDQQPEEVDEPEEDQHE